MSTTVYVSIGNSDDKLTQSEWSIFYARVDSLLENVALTAQIHGRWLSPGNAPWQNACWCVEVPESAVDKLKADLANLARVYRQDSIAWAVAPETEFL